MVGFDLHGGIVCAGIGATAMPDNDAAPPSLESFSIAPDTVSIADAPGEVRFTARITDDVSGAVQKVEGGDETATLNGALSHARFRAPSGLQFIHVVLGGEQLVSGSAQDGTYEYVATIPQYVERGPWELEFILLVDHAGNQETLTPDVLSERWLPTSFVVE